MTDENKLDDPANDGRALFGWFTERKSVVGNTYFVGNGFGASRLLLSRAPLDQRDVKGRQVWNLYVIPDTDKAKLNPGARRYTPERNPAK